MEKLIRFITRLLSLTIILLALVVIGLRLSLANIELFKSDIQSWLARDVAPGIRFAGIKGSWNQFNPILELSNASIVLPGRQQTTAIDNMSVEFDIRKSLGIGSPVVREVSGTISRLSLRKDSNQQWWLNDISLGRTSRENSKSNIEQLIELFPHYIHLDINRLIVFDQFYGEKYQIDNIEIYAQQRSGTHYLQLDANLPDLLGNKIEIKSIISQENRVGYIKSDRLEFDRLASLLGINTGGIRQAELGGEVWLNFLDKQTLMLNGNISVNNGLIQLQAAGDFLPFNLDSQIAIYQVDNQWKISNRFDDLSINYLPIQGFGIELTLTMDSGKPTSVEGWVEDFDLYNLRVLNEQLIPAGIADSLIRSELRGQLKNVWFSLDPYDISNLQFTAEAIDIASNSFYGIPGVSRLGGNLTFGNQNAGLELSSSQLSLDFADLFRAPLEIDRFQLKADISLLKDSLLLSVPAFVAANSDIKTFGRLWLEADEAGTPFLYLRANFEDGNGSSTPKYLPVKIMPERVVKWLDRGIKAVDVSDGNFLYHGRLENIQSLSKYRSGEMMVGFEVDNTEVLFDSNWAPARNGKGRVLFHNMGMEVDLDSASFESIDDVRAKVSIDDFKNTIVEVDVNTQTSTQMALQTWIGTPVGQKYDSVVNNLHDAEGSVLASIGLSLPIEQGNSNRRVGVNLHFEGAAVKAPTWGLDFSQIVGDLRVTEKTIAGEGIKAFFYQDPVDIDVNTDEKNDQTVISANGLIDSQQLLNLLPDYLTQGFTGSSQWKIKVGIANGRPKKAEPMVEINAKSELENTRTLIPEPFSKPVNSTRDTALNISIFEGESIVFDVVYGPEVKAQGQLIPDAEKAYRLSALGVGFSTPLKPLSSVGINVYGTLSNMPLDEWIEYYTTQVASDNQGPGDAISLINTVDLDLNTILFHGRAFTGTELVMSRVDDGFAGTIQSSLLKGSFNLPLRHSPPNPILVNLDYIKIQPKESESQPLDLMPKNFFNLKLHSKVMSYGQFLVTDFRLDTRVEDNQLTIDTLAFARDNISLTSSASWKYLNKLDEHRSALNLSITGKEIGQTVAALGFGDTMQDGEVIMDGQIRWSGDLFNLDWDSLKGDARLEITKGILKNIEPGSGRFVGLLSLNALPRRLALDFKDVVFEGMVFDKITGTYKIEGENLYTDDTKMEGASAKVLILGKIGLRQRDYDQTMLVIPKIRQTLPVIGGFAAGSGVGWGLLLIQKLFKKAIDKSVEVEYKVTGSWDDPQVELVKKVIKNEEREFNDK